MFSQQHTPQPTAPMYYILDENDRPVRVSDHDAVRWAQWMSDHPEQRWLRQQHVGSYYVSTVFLGLDHNFTDEGPPVLWETMVFEGKTDLFQQRSTSAHQALTTHKMVVARLRLRLPLNSDILLTRTN